MKSPARIGRPPALTQEVIARAVIDVGFEDLTVAAVRNRLGVGQTTIYRYAADRDELVRIGLAYLVDRAPWPSLEGPWRQVVSEHAITLWNLWAEHPGAATEAVRGVLPLSILRLTDDLCAVLLRQGFEPADAILACDVLFDMVTDNRRHLEHHQRSGDLREIAADLKRNGVPCPIRARADPASRPATEDECRTIHTAIEEAVTADPLNWFTRKLRVVLDGMEHSLAP